MNDELQNDLELIETTAIEALDGTTERGPALEAIRDRAQKAQRELDG